MNITDVLKHYRTQSAVADALSIEQAAVAKWVKKQNIPDLRQLQLESITGGILKAEKGILPKRQRQPKPEVPTLTEGA